MGRHKKVQPAEGGAVGGGEFDVRGPVRDMLAPGSEDDFKESLPEQTSSDAPLDSAAPTTRKKRRTKAEIAAEKGEAQPVDKRLERANAKMSGLGLAQLTEAGFTLSGQPLNDEEKEDVSDQFYAISKKAGVDPSGSWLFVIAYTIVLLARLILSRTELGEQIKAVIKEFFEKKKEDGDDERKQKERN